ncbi:MAG: hypothetical protein A2161_03000 [Candidatus Schekmanbacteria bacterium RBG_13_48_7]|uniref:Methyltransferase FkbM domain-containing protein n=1 Tax=Candidatus Schekmanbacteria bacterium RBG_13_48_7 TaxID=1817878 RepID=A0A1F7RY30_9BACT|nr:MAG: hypothetical protein A2161_03000 [Candidatus Schekmanbacteria bacterium RBG_13_48_7]
MKLFKNFFQECFSKSAVIAGTFFRLFPYSGKRLFAEWWGDHTHTDITGKWISDMAQIGYSSVSKSMETVKTHFKFSDKNYNYCMTLDITQYVQRKYFFENYGQELAGIMFKYLKPDSVFVDIGAHVGYFSVLAAQIAINGEIICFEPLPQNYTKLVQNININRLKNASINQLGLSNQSGTFTLHVDPYNDGGHSFDDNWCFYSHPLPVNVVTFDEWTEKNKINRIDFIKIDVEGHELNVIQGMVESLKKFKPGIIFCEANEISELPIINLLESHGYKHSRQIDKYPGPKHPKRGLLCDLVFHHS